MESRDGLGKGQSSIVLVVQFEAVKTVFKLYSSCITTVVVQSLRQNGSQSPRKFLNRNKKLLLVIEFSVLKSSEKFCSTRWFR